MMKKALFFAVLLASFAVNAATTTIRLLYVYTPSGLAVLNKTMGSASGFDPVSASKVDATVVTEKFTQSQIDAKFVVAGTYLMPSEPAGNTLQLQMNSIANNYNAMKARDDSNADIVIVFSEPTAPGDAIGTTNGCADIPGIIAVTLASKGYARDNTAHEIGHILCATHARSVVIKTGSSQTDCQVYRSIMTTEPLDRSFPLPTWRIGEGGLGSPEGVASGNGATPMIANQAMSSYCSAANFGNWRYTCSAISCGSVPVPVTEGGSVTCSHNRTEENTFTQFKKSQAIESMATYSLSYFQCPRVTPTNLFEGPDVLFNSFPHGDATKNNVYYMNTRLPTVSNYHTFKVSPGIPH